MHMRPILICFSDTAKVFTSLSLFTLLSEPLGSLIMALAAFMGGVGSFQRIQQFLVSKPTPDRRKFPFLRTSIDSASDVGYDSDKDSKASQKSRYSLEIAEMGSSEAIVIENGYFGWDEEKQPMGWMQGIDMTVPRAKITMVGTYICQACMHPVLISSQWDQSGAGSRPCLRLSSANFR
jgi:ATP-binding cassette subfamily C (CFTR/MRP) protein 1